MRFKYVPNCKMLQTLRNSQASMIKINESILKYNSKALKSVIQSVIQSFGVN